MYCPHLMKPDFNDMFNEGKKGKIRNPCLANLKLKTNLPSANERTRSDFNTSSRNLMSPPEFQIKRNKDHGGRYSQNPSRVKTNIRSKVSSPSNEPLKLKKERTSRMVRT